MTTPVATLELESPFNSEELFFSTTDAKGVIRSGNEVFRRVSEFSFEELIGRPHSIIRHPDMPRAVFKLLWDYLEEKKTIVAFVKNQSKNGKYYWVIAYVKPVEGGYLSVRFKPSNEIISIIAPIYKSMREIEQAQGDKGPARKVGMDKAADFLLEKLKGLGFSSYDDFMYRIFIQELGAHCVQLGTQDSVSELIADQGSLESYLKESTETDHVLMNLIDQMKVLADAEKTFGEITTTITLLSDSVRLFSMNASVESIKLGELGRTVSILAQFLGTGSAQLKMRASSLLQALGVLMPKVKRLMFDIAGAKLLIEMVTVFLREEVRRENSVEHTKEIALRIKALIEAFSAVHTEVSTHLNEVVGAFPQILSIADEVSQGSRELSFVHVSGRIEAVQLPPGCSFASILDSMSTKIVQAEEQLVLLRRVCTQVQTGLGQCVPSLYSVDSYIGLMKGLMS